MLYTIKNNQLEVTINSVGAEIKSIKFEGEDRLHDSNPKFWSRSAPILFPNVGKFKNDITNIKGQPYKLPKHGFMRDSDMQVVQQNEYSITFSLVNNEKTEAIYPFAFEVMVKYVLINNELESTIIVKNNSQDVMPFNLGLHPAFKVPLGENKFEDYHLEFNNAKTYHTPAVDLITGTIDFNQNFRTFENLKVLPLNYSDYDYDAIVLTDINFDQVSLHQGNTKLLDFKFNGFNSLGIWTPNNNVFANFICIEPWHGCADPSDHDGIYEHKKDIIFLEPTDSKLFSYSFAFFK